MFSFVFCNSLNIFLSVTMVDEWFNTKSKMPGLKECAFELFVGFFVD